MNDQRRTIAFIVVAVAAGLFAVILMGQYMKGEEEKRDAVLSQELQKNVEPLKQQITALETELVSVKQMATQKAAVAERPTIVPQSSLALKTPTGKRAVTVKMDSLAAVGGLVNPGDFVDIMAQIAPPGAQQMVGVMPPQTLTSMIFQNVQVLAVGANVGAPGVYEAQQQAKDLIITVALDPEEAGLLNYVQQNGKLQLALRSPNETETYTLPVANWQTLSDYVLERQGTELGGSKSKGPSVESAVEEVKPYIQIFRGGREL